MPMLQKQVEGKSEQSTSTSPAEKLLEVIEQDMKKYSAAEKSRKWDALQNYVSRARGDARAKR